MPLTDRTGLRRVDLRRTPELPTPSAPAIKHPCAPRTEHPAALRQNFDAASDERQYMSELEYVLVSIAAIMSMSPAPESISDERIQRMILSLQGLSAPYLQDSFKREAQVSGRKPIIADPLLRARGIFPAPADAAAKYLKRQQESESRFFDMRKDCEKRSAEKKLFERTQWMKKLEQRKDWRRKHVAPAPAAPVLKLTP